MATDKQMAREVLETLPDDCSIKDIAYHLYVRAKVAQGLRDLDEGRTASHEEVMGEAARWLHGR